MLKSSHPFRSRRGFFPSASDASSSPRFLAFFAFFAAFFAASSARASRIASSSSPLGLSGILVWSASKNSGPSMSSTAAFASRSARSLTTSPLGASAKNLVLPLASSPVTGHENFASTANRNEDASTVCVRFVSEGSSPWEGPAFLTSFAPRDTSRWSLSVVKALSPETCSIRFGSGAPSTALSRSALITGSLLNSDPRRSITTAPSFVSSGSSVNVQLNHRAKSSSRSSRSRTVLCVEYRTNPPSDSCFREKPCPPPSAYISR
mmetsp:Transcript_12583/g.52738  ORF Transcript_12583/g.52738 Transcript_12583/m.52738 type:complete len:264 (+) Transcript_12583:214-1005(+)